MTVKKALMGIYFLSGIHLFIFLFPQILKYIERTTHQRFCVPDVENKKATEKLHPLKNILIKLGHNLKKFDTWKIQLTINNVLSSKDNDEECVRFSKSHNVEIMINDETDEVIEELFESVHSRYQI